MVCQSCDKICHLPPQNPQCLTGLDSDSRKLRKDSMYNILPPPNTADGLDVSLERRCDAQGLADAGLREEQLVEESAVGHNFALDNGEAGVILCSTNRQMLTVV
jgi:hypothetical protein